MQKNPANRPVQKYRVNIEMEIDNYQWEILLFNKESTIKNTFKFLVVTIIGF